MKRLSLTVLVGAVFIIAAVAFAAVARPGQDRAIAVAVAARAGAVTGTDQNSDEFIWRLLAQFAAPVYRTRPSPVVFETWASDKDVFSTTPRWPDPDDPKRFQRSLLDRGKESENAHATIDVPCAQPGNATIGGFPTRGRHHCIAEEVKRNRPQFDYIVQNNLNTQAGLSRAFASNLAIVMPDSAVAVKGDWVPVQTLLEWIPSLTSLDSIRRVYYTNTSEGQEYALVSLHVSSRQNANWVWGTFEHRMNPGRCDDLGCYDTFGAVVRAVAPNHARTNTQYGACEKTARLRAVMAQAHLSPVWENYCLKSTQVDYTAPDGTPYALGNSVIERIVGNGTVAASSCIGCHVYAAFNASGAADSTAAAMLTYNPTGRPDSTVLRNARQFDFMWGVLQAPPPDTASGG